MQSGRCRHGGGRPILCRGIRCIGRSRATRGSGIFLVWPWVLFGNRVKFGDDPSFAKASAGAVALSLKLQRAGNIKLKKLSHMKHIVALLFITFLYTASLAQSV